jgi:metallo-beta-lactamase family protein
LKIAFHGAARMVTGSKHIITTDTGKKILLDCGLFQGNPRETEILNKEWGFEPSEISYLILSHAHIDHSGLIPKLVKDGFKGKIYCTPGTYDMAEVLLYDSAHIHISDIKYFNKKRARANKKAFEPLYNMEDVDKCLPRFVKVDYDKWFKIDEEVKFIFKDAGHIIGSASVSIVINEKGKEKRITFSGDIGRYNDEILRSPQPFPQADIIICESTYGDSLHQPIEVVGKQLLETIIETCVNKKGNLIIPAFSVGRTQEIVYALNRLEVDKQLPDVDFYVDSPLSVEATNIMKDHSSYYNDKLKEYMKRDPDPFGFKKLHFIKDVEESKALMFEKRPVVIISASGMADAGRVKHHIAHNIEDTKNTILLVGYCEPNSLGGKLKRGLKDVTIFGDSYRVNCEVKSINSLSAHGDYNDLIKFLSCQKAEEVEKLFLVHGEYDVQQIFDDKLKTWGFNHIEVPALHQEFSI